MAYAQSKHVRDLDTEIQGIISNIQTGQSATYPVTVREYCIAAGIFLAHAQFENFFVDLIDSLARIYSSSGASAIPDRLKAHLFMKKSNLQSVVSIRIAGGSEHEFLDRVGTSITGPAKSLIDSSIPLSPLAGDDIHGEQSYPSEKNIKRVLKRIGIGDPKTELDKAIRADAIALLDSLASLRTALAHAGVLPSVTATDVIDRINGLLRFADSFDRVIFKHLSSTHTEALWHSNFV